MNRYRIYATNPQMSTYSDSSCATVRSAVKEYDSMKKFFPVVTLYDRGEQVFEEEFDDLILSEKLEEL